VFKDRFKHSSGGNAHFIVTDQSNNKNNLSRLCTALIESTLIQLQFIKKLDIIMAERVI